MKGAKIDITKQEVLKNDRVEVQYYIERTIDDVVINTALLSKAEFEQLKRLIKQLD